MKRVQTFRKPNKDEVGNEPRVQIFLDDEGAIIVDHEGEKITFLEDFLNSGVENYNMKGSREERTFYPKDGVKFLEAYITNQNAYSWNSSVEDVEDPEYVFEYQTQIYPKEK